MYCAWPPLPEQKLRNCHLSCWLCWRKSSPLTDPIWLLVPVVTLLVMRMASSPDSVSFRHWNYIGKHTIYRADPGFLRGGGGRLSMYYSGRSQILRWVCGEGREGVRPTCRYYSGTGDRGSGKLFHVFCPGLLIGVGGRVGSPHPPQSVLNMTYVCTQIQIFFYKKLIGLKNKSSSVQIPLG
jgi:hypothetical protein